MSHYDRKKARRRVHFRIRKRVSGKTERPRLAVHFSNKHVYAQVINDEAGSTLVAASTVEKGVESGNSASVASATRVGRLIAERAREKKIEAVVFDRGGFIFHGKVRALADAAREGGLRF